MVVITKQIERLNRITWYSLSLFFRLLTQVHKGRVLFWSTEFKTYGDNPKYISEYILRNSMNMFDVYWGFKRNVSIPQDAKDANIVRFYTLRYLYIVNTAEFLITNHRTDDKTILWKKRRGQKYIMTWHGSMPLKKIENDAIDSLGDDYNQFAIRDSNNCDLMLSDNKWFTQTIKRAFWYNGEILETGIPRNDIFFDNEEMANVCNKVFTYYSIPAEYKILLYAPTFRSNNDISHYLLRFKEIKEILEEKFNGKFIVLYRLHPNLLQIVDSTSFLLDIDAINASTYPDIQELLCASDVLITDYSSVMCEYALIKKPCFLYTEDLDIYNRGTYLNLKNVPYILAKDVKELIDGINKCDIDKYVIEINNFVETHFQPVSNLNARKDVVSWMLSHSNSSYA